MTKRSSIIRNLCIVAQGGRLNRLASQQVSDVNEAHLLVHRVMASAMNNRAFPTNVLDLDAALDALCVKVARVGPVAAAWSGA